MSNIDGMLSADELKRIEEAIVIVEWNRQTFIALPYAEHERLLGHVVALGQLIAGLGRVLADPGSEDARRFAVAVRTLGGLPD